MNRNPAAHNVVPATAAGCFDTLIPQFFYRIDNAAINADVRRVVHSEAFFNRDSPLGQINNYLPGMNV